MNIHVSPVVELYSLGHDSTDIVKHIKGLKVDVPSCLVSYTMTLMLQFVVIQAEDICFFREPVSAFSAAANNYHDRFESFVNSYW